MDFLTAIHVAITVVRYQLRVALVVQMLLLWYVDILGRILQRTIDLTKKALKPLESILELYDKIKNFRSRSAIDIGMTTVQSKARKEAMHLSKEFHSLPLKLQELELLMFSAFRHLVIATQGTVYMQPSTPTANVPLNKLSTNAAASKWKSFLSSAEKTKVRSLPTEKQVMESNSKRWMPSNTTANGSKNVQCEVNTVNSARSHISPSPKISEAYADEVTSLTLSKTSEAPLQLPVIQAPMVEKNDEFHTRGVDGNAWNFSELKGLWVDRKRSRKEDVSDKESVRSIAESNNTQHL